MGNVLLPTWRIAKDTGEILVYPGNELMFGGASAAWELLIGATFTAYSAANAYLGVGDSSEALSPSHTALQGTSTARAGMVAGWPKHNNVNSAEGTRVVFRASFGAGVASFAWLEVGLFNASTGGRMFNRRVVDGGTKGATAVWVLELIFELEPAPGMS